MQGQRNSTTGQAPSSSSEKGMQGQRNSTTGQAPSSSSEKGKSSEKSTQGQKSPTTGQAPSSSERSMQGQKNSTTGQSPTGQSQTNAPERSQTPNATEPRGAGRTGTQGTGQAEGGRAGSNVTFTAEQRTRIRQTVLQASNAPRVDHVDFALNVGTRVPRERVHLVTVPETLVEVHPAWRGFLYFVANDEIIVVDPHTYEIVAVVNV